MNNPASVPFALLARQDTDDPNVESASAEVSEGALRLWESFLEAIPRIGVAITFIIVGWLVSRLVRTLLRRTWIRTHTESFARVLSKLVGWFVLFVFVLAAVTVTFPSVQPVDLLAGFGFFSIAIGFAFQDILENTLSGVLLLFREPFRGGDQIEVQGIRGTVEGITIRETRITTFDGQLVVVPNADVYKNAITVRTANEMRRDEFVVGVAYEADLAMTCQLIIDTLAQVAGVESERTPEALVDNLGASTVDIRARFWTDPNQRNVVQVRSEAIMAVKNALDDAEIEMPCQIVALQATSSYAAALHESGSVTPGGSLAAATP